MSGLPRAALLAAAPVLLAQGRRVRRDTPQLPEAAGTTGRVGPAGEALRLLVAGDSVAVGVGLEDHADSLAGRVSRLLHEQTGRPVEWQVAARSGATAGTARGRVVGLVADAAIVSVGVNDVLGMHSDARWERELEALLAALPVGIPAALLGVPDLSRFPALPRPLADLLGARARRLDAIGAHVAARRGVHHLRLAGRILEGGYAADGFHPSAAAHALIAEEVAPLLV
ncbi:SGNH hydrolase [Nocardioides gansuensis]|uniref:SGNH hydrolase n=1 Tax=Nocardioides gansuensis TaxID=2138300 RepID=A0A2T8FAA1_9ACTN|nr:SGNH/GDSL hydrolase family protein [Nocardioides gansuensis]PVG82610.1 SGNH hydrolase [Nocardioides gansuensis]